MTHPLVRPSQPAWRALLDDAIARSRALRVLEPDASMQALTTESRALVDDCANELWQTAFSTPAPRGEPSKELASLSTALNPPFRDVVEGRPRDWLDDPALDAACAAQREHTPTSTVVRSMRVGLARWQSSRDRALPTPLAMAKARLVQALGRHEGLSLAIHRAIRAPQRARSSGGAAPFAVSAYECLVCDLLWKIAFDSPSPFGLQLRLWDRGVWPVWTDRGELVVFCPVLEGEGVVVCEEDDPRLSAPRMGPSQPGEFCALEDQPPCALDEVIVFGQDGDPRRVWLDRSRAVIEVGRRLERDIVIAEDTISKRHCQFRWSADGWIVDDTASTSGTYVNDERIQRSRALQGGDVLRAGRPLLWFIGSGP